MARDVIQPTVGDDDFESHPAWVLVGASRVSATPGAVLFDSDIRHQHYIVVKVSAAERKRDLNHDWIMGRKRFIEFAMSEAQWASFVSTMNVGDGVPATLTFREGVDVPGMPYEPRLQESMKEVRDAAENAQAEVLAAFQAYKEHKTVGNLRTLEARIDNMPANISFAAKSLSEHAENVVTRARADIEAFVMSRAQQLGLEASDLISDLPALTQGDKEDV